MLAQVGLVQERLVADLAARGFAPVVHLAVLVQFVLVFESFKTDDAQEGLVVLVFLEDAVVALVHHDRHRRSSLKCPSFCSLGWSPCLLNHPAINIHDMIRNVQGFSFSYAISLDATITRFESQFIIICLVTKVEHGKYSYVGGL